MNNDLASKLKLLRKRKGYTQVELAKRLNIPRNTLAFYETNRRTPNPENLKLLADFFDVSVDYLLGEEMEHTSRVVDEVPDGTIAIKGLLEEVFADKPEVLQQIKELRVSKDSKFAGNLSDDMKATIRTMILAGLKQQGHDI